MKRFYLSGLKILAYKIYNNQQYKITQAAALKCYY